MRAFVGESWGELKKVEWPGRRQLFSATIVVIVAIAVVGAYLAAADFAFSRLVRDVLLRF
ncbi:MAG: preprotein translocase subunit SecE [Actinobacteria bacterium]|nr:preprotein translocase subunit SecE [Actinomycetota bacterium]